MHHEDGRGVHPLFEGDRPVVEGAPEGIVHELSLGGECRLAPVCDAIETVPELIGAADDNFRRAVSRKTLGLTTNGREILQRRRTNARDFEYVEPLRRPLQTP